MQDLIERLEKATGPDLEADRLISCLLIGRDDVFFATGPYYTESIDAAVELVPEGWAWFVERIDGFTNGDARIWLPAQHTHGLPRENFDVRKAATPAIALCIAALKVRRSDCPHSRARAVAQGRARATMTMTMTERVPDRRNIDWRLGWIDRRRCELEGQLADLNRQECEILGLKPDQDYTDGEGWE